MPVSSSLPAEPRTGSRPVSGWPELVFLLPLVITMAMGTFELIHARAVDSRITGCLNDQLPSGLALSEGWQSRLSQRLANELNIDPDQVRIHVQPDVAGQATVQISVPYAANATLLGGWLTDARLNHSLTRPLMAG